MAAIKGLHSRLFEKLIAKQQQELLFSLGAGHVADYAAYRQVVGHIEGLAVALRLSEQADFEISGDEPSASS